MKLKKLLMLLLALVIFTVGMLFVSCNDEDKEYVLGNTEELGNTDDPGDTGNPGENSQTYYVTFVIDGGIILKKVPFTTADMKISEPDVPKRTCYVGEWENYTLSAKNITVNAVY